MVNRLERQKRETGSTPRIACMMFDLNNLKQINDKLGHSAGDRALTGQIIGCMRIREGKRSLSINVF
nr:diguanylate cyclase [Clostridium sp. MCC353]